MTDARIGTWVDQLVTAHRTGQRIEPTSGAPDSIAQTYEIQRRVAAQLGPVGGFKTARKGDAPPIMAPIYASRVVRSGARVSVRDLMGIELEVGFEMLRDCPVGGLPAGVSELQVYLRPVVVVELVDTRIKGSLAENADVKLADNQINAGLVDGDAATDWAGQDFGNLQARMTAGADLLLDGKACVPGGSALEAIKKMSAELGDHCGGLKRGQIVITGSLHPLVYYPPGTHVEGWIDGIGSVSVTLGDAPSVAM